MGERNQTRSNRNEADDDFYDPMLSDMGDDDFDDIEEAPELSDKAALAAKRRRAERRLEALRLREELGDYDFEFDDDL